MAGALGDTIWHAILGIEVNVDALYSPTHLVLALGGILMITGPIRSGWNKTLPEAWGYRFPLVLSLALLLSVLTFFTQVMHPLVNPSASGLPPATGHLTFLNQALGVSGVMIQSAILAGIVLMALSFAPLPSGTFTLILGLNAVGTSLLTEGSRLPLILGATVAGLIADSFITTCVPGLAGVKARSEPSPLRCRH